MANVVSSRQACYARDVKKGQETWDGILRRVSPAIIWAKDEEGNPILDANGNKVQLVIDDVPQESPIRFQAVVYDPQDKVDRILWPLKSMFLNGVVPEIPGMDGLPVRVTTYLDDQDRSQVAEILYNKADLTPMSSDMKAALATGNVKMSFN